MSKQLSNICRYHHDHSEQQHHHHLNHLSHQRHYRDHQHHHHTTAITVVIPIPSFLDIATMNTAQHISFRSLPLYPRILPSRDPGATGRIFQMRSGKVTEPDACPTTEWGHGYTPCPASCLLLSSRYPLHHFAKGPSLYLEPNTFINTIRRGL